MNATLCTRYIDDTFIKCWLLRKKPATFISKLPTIWEMPDCVSVRVSQGKLNTHQVFWNTTEP